MPRRARFFLFLSLSLVCLAASAALTTVQAARYRDSLARFPAGTLIGGIPAGGLTAEQAGQRLAQAFTSTPVELRLDSLGAPPVHIDPLSAGLQLDLAGMLARASQQAQGATLAGLWDFLWNRPTGPLTVPAACGVDETRLNAYLSALLEGRYAAPATRAHPIPGDVRFTPGQPGAALDIAGALPSVSGALCSLDARSIALQTTAIPALPPAAGELNPMLAALVQGSGFDGVLELYFQDVQSGTEFSLAYANGQPVQPGIAFTAASTIKIPVLVSAYKRLDGEIPADLRAQMELMIELSDNGSTDEVMQRVLDANLAPMQVSEDAQALGLRDTFLAGFFYPGAPLLNIFETPANRRSDISTDPDIYNQTSASDMGRLLAAIQTCAAGADGPLQQAFAGQVTQAECQEMLELLSKNKKGVLIENGLPEGAHMARKYGWVTDPADGLMHSASDAALVFSPNGTFVLTVYLYHPEQLQWDAAQRLAARLGTAVSNYYLSLK